jgi:acyl-CoA dehydrogenase
LRDALKTVSDLAGSDATGRAIDDPISRCGCRDRGDIDTLEMTELRVLSALQTGKPGAVSSLLKLRVSEIRQAVTRLGVEVIGRRALCRAGTAALRLNEAPESRGAAGGAGISQRPGVYDLRRLVGDQRDIMAKMVLGL